MMELRTRRDFLSSSFKTFTLGLTAPQFLAMKVKGEGLDNLLNSKKVLVVIQLGGGNDGINTVIPYGDAAYYDERPNIAIPQENVLKVNERIGLNPGLSKLKEMYDANRVAIINGVGYPNQSRSHFRGMEIWHTANNATVAKNGWLGNYFDLNGSQIPSSIKGINVGGQLPKALNCDHCTIPSIGSLSTYQIKTDGSDGSAKINAFREVNSELPPEKPFVGLLQNTATDALNSSETLKTIATGYQTTVQYPNSGFANGLRFISQVISANLGTKVFYISTGGFDTHSNQVNSDKISGAHDNLLTNFATSVEAFYRDLVEHGKAADVVMMVFSEFGRRVRSNGSNGTDHGAAGPMFVIGDMVKGGTYVDYPSLTSLDSNNDLKMGVDFRSIYAEVLERVLEADSRTILGDSYPTLNFL